MKKSVVVALLCACMSIGILTGCGQTKQETSKEASQSVASSQSSAAVESSATEEKAVEEWSYPLTSDADLSVYSLLGGLEIQDEYKGWEESPFHSGLAERTGLAIDWQYPAKGAEPATAYNLLWVEKELPSIVMASNIEVSEAQQLYQDGMIWDLTDYIPVYAPDWWAIISSPEYEKILDLHTAPDGRIYSICKINDNAYGASFQGVMIRQDWLEEQKLEVPVTLEDYENVIKVFKEKYGAVLTFAKNRFLSNGFTAGTGCYGPVNASFYNLDGEIRFAQTDDQYKEFLTVMNKWHAEGLIDADAFANDDNAVRAKALNDQAGIVIGAQSTLLNLIQDAEAEGSKADWTGIPYPTTAEGAPNTFNTAGAINYLGMSASAVITTACSEEEMIEALKWLNYGFTEEGSYYWLFGEEGVTYNKTETGGIVWTDLINNHALGATEAKKRYTGDTGMSMAYGLQSVVEAGLHPKQIEARIAWRENSVAGEHMLPSLIFTADEQATKDQYFPAIQTYVQEQSLKFIMGEESLDNWDGYLKTLEGFGLESVREVYQSAWDNFNK